VDVIATHCWRSVRNDGGRYSEVDIKKLKIMVRILKDMLKVNLAMENGGFGTMLFFFLVF
jgi:hypothetical protein